MFRTRDFVLFVIVAIFLVMAIGFSIFSKKEPQSVSGDQYVATTITEVTAVSGTDADPVISRAERLAALREKIAQSDLVIENAETIESEALDLSDNEIDSLTATTSTPGELLLCPDYRQLTRINWPVADIQMIQAEGVRQYYTEQSVMVGTGTTSATTLVQNVRLTLPVQFVPIASGVSCLPTDVIGVALDGSLIRNTEATLYSVFGSETLIGYALDGFPIYGVGQSITGECGGRIQLGQYRYELSVTRDTILNCFSGSPQSFTP